MGRDSQERNPGLEIEPPIGTPPLVRVHWPLRRTTAAAMHYPAVAAGIRISSPLQPGAVSREATMKRDLQALALFLGGLLTVAGSGLLVLSAVLS